VAAAAAGELVARASTNSCPLRHSSSSNRKTRPASQQLPSTCHWLRKNTWLKLWRPRQKITTTPRAEPKRSHFLADRTNSGVNLCSGLGGRTSESRRAEARDPKGRGGVRLLGRGQLAPPHQLGGEGLAPPVWFGAKPRPLVILVLFEPSRTRVETTVFSLKTNNLEGLLRDMAQVYVNVLTLQ